jgi:putative oxidoreductase
MKIVKLIFSGKINSNILDWWLLLIRILLGVFMLTHGIPKIMKLASGEEVHFVDPIGIGAKASFILMVFAEFLCSILIILGVFTRLATIPLMIGMFVATFISHGGDPFSGKELALLYLLFFATICVTGSGKYSIDYLVSKKIDEKNNSYF